MHISLCFPIFILLLISYSDGMDLNFVLGAALNSIFNSSAGPEIGAGGCLIQECINKKTKKTCKNKCLKRCKLTHKHTQINKEENISDCQKAVETLCKNYYLCKV